MLSAILPAIGMFAGFAASVLAFLAGLRWRGGWKCRASRCAWRGLKD